MATLAARRHPRPIHPIHAILLSFLFPLFLGALLADLAYWSSQHVQWINFAAWLNAGGLLMGAFALVWALVDLIRARRGMIYFLLLLAAWVVGFFNALVHGKDAWATMPAGLWLSVVATLLALAATWIGFASARSGEVK